MADTAVHQKRKVDATGYPAPETEPVAQKIQKTGTEGTTAGATGTFCTNPQFIWKMTHTQVDMMKPASNVVLVAQRTDMLSEVWKGMVRNNFLSCPVLQKTKQRYYGYIDLHDIVSFIIKKFEISKLETSKDYWKLMEADKEFLTMTVGQVIANPIMMKNPYHPIHLGFSLFSAIELLAKVPTLHRIPIIDNERQLKSILTQSQVIDYLVANIDSIGSIRTKPVSMMEAGNQKVFHVAPNLSALEAFKYMVDSNVTGLAVCDTDGKLMDAISLKDLKVISTDGRMFWRLYQTVEALLTHLRKETKDFSRPQNLIYVLPTQTFEDVLRAMCANHIHRVFVVDNASSMKPTGVITMKDILKEVITH